MAIAQRTRHAGSSNMIRKVVAASVGAAASVTLIGAAALPASAATSQVVSHHGHGPATDRREVTGIVASVGTGTFTVNRGASIVTIDVSTATKYSEKGAASPTVASVLVGEKVSVSGTVASPGVIDALAVRILQPRGHVFTGVVATVGTGTFTLTRGTSVITVDVTTTTTYAEKGVTSPTLVNVTAGERVSVSGFVTAPGVVDALAVRIFQSSSDLSRHIFTGKVASVGTGTFTVTRGSSTITVDVTPTTTYADEGVTSPTLANVTGGEKVAVYGDLSSTSTVNALAVWVLPADTNLVHGH
ncbi:MAG: hypothetical protein JWO62_2082 [Acidimicrobiaceae bacterium]|nr:hypothetical protein [Acidimicrobiaceae bacterium]